MLRLDRVFVANFSPLYSETGSRSDSLILCALKLLPLPFFAPGRGGGGGLGGGGGCAFPDKGLIGLVGEAPLRSLLEGGLGGGGGCE